MRRILAVLVVLFFTGTAFSQEKFPLFTNDALVETDSSTYSQTGEYKLLIYGAIGCSYSRYLIENIKALDNCGELEIILLLNDPKDAIMKEYPEQINSYRVYSNDIQHYQLTKNNDITPQTILFRNDEQLLHIKGVKKNMFVKIQNEVSCQ